MYKLKKEFNISCSHRLNNKAMEKEWNQKIYGRCNNLPSHGHNYKIFLKLQSPHPDGDNGMIINFNKIKEIFNERIDCVYDHQFLNDSPGFEELVPTAENMSYVFYQRLKPFLGQLVEVEIYETDGASASYTEKE